MTIFVTFCVGLTGILASRFAFRKWFNHVSLYTGIWSLSVMLFEWRLIKYYPFELETWVVIIQCWLLFVVGAMTVVACQSPIRSAPFAEGINAGPVDDHQRLKRLRNTLRVLNVATFLGALYHAYLLSRLAGGLSRAFIEGNLLHSYAASEGLPGRIPYISSFVFAAALLGGSYAAQKDKIPLISVLPFVIIVIIDFANMGRADILTVVLLFASGYFLTTRSQGTRNRIFKLQFRRLVMVLMVAVVVIGGADFIRSARNIQERFRGSTTALKRLGGGRIITPSIYLYLTGSLGVLNSYIEEGGENTPVGGNTFLPVYRILEGLGVEVHADVLQKWYRTPVPVNTGTYLRELHGDFGLLGLLVGPYILGLLSSVYWYRIHKYRRYVDLAMGGFLFTIIGMGFFVMATRVAPVFVYFFVSMVIARYLDRKPSQQLATF